MWDYKGNIVWKPLQWAESPWTVGTISTAVAEPPAVPDKDIDQCLSPREVKKDIEGINQAAIDAYSGSTLAAEVQSRSALELERRQVVDSVKYRSIGRRIDLRHLLGQCRKDKKGPKWSLVDPRRPIGQANGCYNRGGLWVGGDGGLYASSHHGYYLSVTVRGLTAGSYTPSGIPPLPQPVRDLFTAEKHQELRDATMWMGVLYQPEEWKLQKPDPAVVCEYKAIPGEHYCLMVWGGDRAQIEEWID